MLEQIAPCEHVVSFLSSFLYREHLFIITELLGQTLATHYRSLSDTERLAHYSEPEMKVLLKQVLSAASALHDLGITHCDLKTDNVCLASNGYKVIDLE